MTEVQGGGVPAGTQLNGIYEIERRVAMGGMGEVYIGRAIQTRDRVAIKMILPEHAHNQTILDLFRREASTLHNLYHEAIVRYYVFSIDPVLDRPYLAMEYAGGPSLADRIRERPLTEAEMRVLVPRLASGLAAAHKLGVIHRDISPDNVILVDGAVANAKIIDFGIAKSSSADGTLIGGGFAGKLNYVSPEQLGLEGGDVTGQSDIYSLGLVLAEAAIGRPLPMSGTQVEVIEKRRRVPDLTEVPAYLRPLVQHMTQPRPADRPADMTAVASWGQEGSRTGTTPPSAKAQAPARKGGFPWLIVGLGVAAAAAAAAVFVVTTLTPEPVAPPPTTITLAPSSGGKDGIGLAPAPAKGSLRAPVEGLTATTAVMGASYQWLSPQFTYAGDHAKLAITAEGKIPPGLSVSDEPDGAGLLYGVPGEIGEYHLAIVAQSPEGDSARIDVTLFVKPAEDRPATVAVADTPVAPKPPVAATPVAPTPVAPTPVTPTPVTPTPVTPTPVTPTPVTQAPVTPAPVTPTPVAPTPVAPVAPTPVLQTPPEQIPAVQPAPAQTATAPALLTPAPGITLGDLPSPSLTPAPGITLATPSAPQVPQTGSAPSVGGADTVPVPSTGGALVAQPTPPSEPGPLAAITPTPPPAGPRILDRLLAPASAAEGDDVNLRLGSFASDAGPGALTLRAEGRLPNGLTLAKADDGSARLSGKPKESGDFTFDVVAVDPTGQAATFPIRLLVTPPTANLKTREYILGYQGGACFLSRPMELGPRSARIEVFAAEVDPAIRFDADFKATQGFEAAIELRQITRDQCDLVAALDQVGPRALDNRLRIQIIKDQLKSGENLEGIVEGSNDIHLFLFDNQGGTNPLDEFLSPGATGARFKLPLHANGPQVLIAALADPAAGLGPKAGLEELLGAAARGNASLALGFITVAP